LCGGEHRQHTRGRLHEEDTCAGGIDDSILFVEACSGEIGHRTSKLDAGRSTADDHKSKQCLAQRRIFLAFGSFEGQQHPAPHGGRVIKALQTGRVPSPLILAEVAVPSAGRKHEVVEGNARFEDLRV
jgi:hypothetical protein